MDGSSNSANEYYDDEDTDRDEDDEKAEIEHVTPGGPDMDDIDVRESEDDEKAEIEKPTPGGPSYGDEVRSPFYLCLLPTLLYVIFLCFCLSLASFWP